MAFTYDPTTDLGRCRFILADTVSDNAHFTDAEINAMISVHGSVEGAVYGCAQHACAHAIRASSSRSESGQDGSRAVDDTHRAEHWRDLMDRFRGFSKAATRFPTARVGVSLTPSADGYE